jgi:hypothetical protein
MRAQLASVIDGDREVDTPAMDYRARIHRMVTAAVDH